MTFGDPLLDIGVVVAVSRSRSSSWRGGISVPRPSMFSQFLTLEPCLSLLETSIDQKTREGGSRHQFGARTSLVPMSGLAVGVRNEGGGSFTVKKLFMDNGGSLVRVALYAVAPKSYTLHPTPYTLHPTPCTLHPTSHTPHTTPHTRTPEK